MLSYVVAKHTIVDIGWHYISVLEFIYRWTNLFLDREIDAPPLQNRRSTPRVQNWGWCVFCLFLRFRQFAHHPPQKYHLMRKVICGDGAWFAVPYILHCKIGFELIMSPMRPQWYFRIVLHLVADTDIRWTVSGSSHAPSCQRDLLIFCSFAANRLLIVC